MAKCHHTTCLFMEVIHCCFYKGKAPGVAAPIFYMKANNYGIIQNRLDNQEISGLHVKDLLVLYSFSFFVLSFNK